MFHLHNCCAVGVAGHAWQLVNGADLEKEGIALHFNWRDAKQIPSPDIAKENLRNLLNKNPIDWLCLRNKRFLLELDRLRQVSPYFECMEWLRGYAFIEPDIQIIPHLSTHAVFYAPISSSLECEVRVTSDTVGGGALAAQSPAEIAESLAAFKADHPNPRATGFVMMRIADTPAHTQINQAIRETLLEYGIDGLRADGKEYHSHLWRNIQTYMHGCGFGIAVFERIEEDRFNPNVALEVGYMLAMGKPVCLLKDRTLSTLHTDLIGKLYRPFDPQDIARTVAEVLPKWLRDKGLANPRAPDETTPSESS